MKRYLVIFGMFFLVEARGCENYKPDPWSALGPFSTLEECEKAQKQRQNAHPFSYCAETRPR
mgnify:CR=1 FL=1